MSRAWAVLLAAGKGERAGFERNKVFQPVQGRSAVARVLDAIADSGAFAGAVLVLSPADRALWRELEAREGPFPLLWEVADGGKTRQESALSGLKRVPADAELVAIHDAARPFASPEIFRQSLFNAAKYGSGVAAISVVDTIKRVDAETGSVTTPNRDELFAAQTPQSFRLPEILRAHEQAAREGFPGTDDAQIYEKYIGSVRLFSVKPDSDRNLKLTTREDFRRLFAPRMRVGSGYDAHRLAAGRKLMLCGIEVPHERGLDGHSDADVAVHALMDALLGALGEGDIGRHFPDGDARFRDICSMQLLEAVMELVATRGFRVENADVTIVAQKPKLAPFLDAMRDNLIRALGCPAVNVKATTTERMGFEGEEIGISAQAVALITSQEDV